MEFTYIINPYSGRQVLACDFCDAYKGDKSGTKWVRKIAWPYGYCQAWATCNNCYAKGRHKVASCFETAEMRTNHNGCKIIGSKTRVKV